jgi:hypothetical protein
VSIIIITMLLLLLLFLLERLWISIPNQKKEKKTKFFDPKISEIG